MRAASDELDFETAARLRDVARGLDSLAREQRVHRTGGGSLDVVGLARDGDIAAGVVMRIRSGLLLGRESLRFADILEESDEDLLASLAARRARRTWPGRSSFRRRSTRAPSWPRSSPRRADGRWR